MFVSRHTPRVVAAEAAVNNVTPVGDLALEEPVYQFCAYVEPGDEHLFMDIMTSMLILNIVLLLAGCVQMGDG